MSKSFLVLIPGESQSRTKFDISNLWWHKFLEIYKGNIVHEDKHMQFNIVTPNGQLYPYSGKLE